MYPVHRSLPGLFSNLARRLRRKEISGAPTLTNKQWFDLVRSVNRRLLLTSLTGTGRDSEWVKEFIHAGSPLEYEYSWKGALNLHASEYVHRLYGEPEELATLTLLFDRNIDALGQWSSPIDRVDYSMKGFSLLYIAEINDNPKYKMAAEKLLNSLLVVHPRDSDGCLPYGAQSGQILVDTLGMICPFLARYSRLYGHDEAINLSINQLKQFVLNNVDNDSKLPYHGYYTGGPYRLGLHAWGRGTGWYMLGLIDTILEMSLGHPDRQMLIDAYIAAAESLQKFQRPDGHWNWAILHRNDHIDSSTTSLLGYSLARGLYGGILDDSFQPTIVSALNSLISVTSPDGILKEGLGECRGLGKYPQLYGAQPWLQGASTAFAAICIDNLNGKVP